MSDDWRKPENELHFRDGCIREPCMREPCFREPCEPPEDEGADGDKAEPPDGPA